MPDRTFLGYDEALLEAMGGAWTAQEIAHQPATLRATQARLEAERPRIEAFLQPLLSQADLRVILTGAGTSGFIGDSLAPWLAARLQRRVDAVATTDLACAPDLYLAPGLPTLLVSFARSGNSPESVAAVELANRLLPRVHHLAITCNGGGGLAQAVSGTESGLVLVLPEATHDRGFAMTSSYTGMTLAALSAFLGPDAMAGRVGSIADAVAAVIADHGPALKAAADEGYDRVAYLGSHVMQGMAREAALKLMELTNGATVTLFDSPLGLRHGPKTFINQHTLVFLFLSNDPYTRRYDLDLLDELRRDGEARRIIVLTAQDGMDGPDHMRVHGLERAEDIDLIFPYVAAAQVFAFQQSARLGLTPDRPNARGVVNRVVQGVRIHERL